MSKSSESFSSGISEIVKLLDLNILRYAVDRHHRRLTTDAHLAALAIEHDAEQCSTDTDFGRFPRVRWTNLLAL